MGYRNIKSPDHARLMPRINQHPTRHAQPMRQPIVTHNTTSRQRTPRGVLWYLPFVLFLLGLWALAIFGEVQR